ncbi:dynein regulatory complex subunit 2-like [Sardina pilchardus]|uniref:dynein regulatory complex subunit 2-like n=1 Tax=Sardina pilchardus TaxID=27697 RepID=UPI002E0FEE52
MPKKGGKGKQAAMTEEERLAYMQQKAQAEEEMAKRKEDMLTLFLKEKLQKEEKNSAVNLHKLTQQWRAVLRQTRATELRRDISILSQTFERVLDRKDSVIKSLVCDVNEAEQQSAQALRAHLNCADRLLELQKGRLAILELKWTSSLEELMLEYNTVREHLGSQHQQDTAYLADVTFAMEQHYAELDNEAKQDYQSMRDDIKNRNIEEKHALRVQLEGTVEELWGQFQHALRSYNEATEDRHIAFEALRTRDHKSAQEIDTQMRRLQKMQDSISALRVRLGSGQRDGESAARGLRAAREEVTHQARQLKAQLSHARAAERSQLGDLTLHSNTAAKKLQAIITQGEKLLRLAEMCRKLETEEEKVVPFYESSLTPQEQSLDRATAAQPPSEELAKAMVDFEDLGRFWRRHNKVVLERACLEQERAGLSRENQRLRVLLRQYLEGISVSDEILRHQNPLLMVQRQPLGAPPAAAATAAQRQGSHGNRASQPLKRHTVIEAAHVVQHTL